MSRHRHYSYDANNRLTGDNNASYGYDAGNNPTTYVNDQTQTFDPADELRSTAARRSARQRITGGGQRLAGWRDRRDGGSARI